jgi:hypothetical protein
LVSSVSILASVYLFIVIVTVPLLVVIVSVAIITSGPILLMGMVLLRLVLVFVFVVLVLNLLVLLLVVLTPMMKPFDELLVGVLANVFNVIPIHVEVPALASQCDVSVRMFSILVKRVDVRRRRSIFNEVVHRRADTLG